MQRIAVVPILLVLLCAAALAEIPPENYRLARPNAAGDYVGRPLQRAWEVVDTDPAGVNGRRAADFPKDWIGPSSRWPRMNIKDWPVVERFSSGEVILAHGGAAGFFVVDDERNRPWLKAMVGLRDEICMVRANKAFVRPLAAWPVTAVIKDADGFTNLRVEPSTSARIVSKIYRGEPFLALLGREEWVRALSPAGRMGWMHRSRLRVVAEHAYGAARVVDPDGYVNVRTGPSTSHPVAGRARSGQVVVLRDGGEWAQVWAPGPVIGYVHASRLQWVRLK